MYCRQNVGGRPAVGPLSRYSPGHPYDRGMLIRDFVIPRLLHASVNSCPVGMILGLQDISGELLQAQQNKSTNWTIISQMLLGQQLVVNVA